MRGYGRGILALGLIALLAGPTLAQERQQRGQPGGGRGFGQFGLAGLVQNEGVQKELKLDKEVADKVRDAVQKVQAKYRDDFAKLRDLPQEERGPKTQALSRTVNEETLKAVGDILKPDQLKRLKQIELQQAGVQAFSRPEVQKALNLTDEQKQKIRTIAEESGREMRELFGAGNPAEARDKIAELRKKTTEKIQGVLTADQKRSWKELTGEPFELRLNANPRPRPDR
jgi:Spy/CpxP family protein refolding chaperone